MRELSSTPDPIVDIGFFRAILGGLIVAAMTALVGTGVAMRTAMSPGVQILASSSSTPLGDGQGEIGQP